MPVLVPLAYTGSVLCLILSAGTTSGVGIVILFPLIWTALFGQLWESGCVVTAIVAVEVVISLTPVAVPAAVTARRVILWAALGMMLSVSTHGLRDRIRRARQQAARLQDRLREVSLVQDRDRIAGDLQDKVIQRIFAAGLTLQSAAMRTTDQGMRRRIEETVDDLDDAVVILRDTVYGLEHRLEGRGLRAEVLQLCEDLHVAPELSFSGPVDGALPSGARAGFVELLRDALALIEQHFVPARLEITASRGSYTAMIEARPLAGEGGTTPSELSGLQDKAAQAGVGIDIEPGPDSTRFAWRVPVRPAR
jgi:signal transduction histidine kinase